MAKIKVLIIDDSAVVRQMLTEILNADPKIEVVGTAHDPYMARDRIKKYEPDVLTLDVEMPKMDGLTFLSNLMRLRPMPVVMVSTLTQKGAETTLQALELGAVDFVSKPKIDFAHTIQEYQKELIEKVKAAAQARVRPIEAKPKKEVVVMGVVPKLSADAILDKPDSRRRFKTTEKIIAIGASTGGTEAIREILEVLPPDAPGIVISQHIPESFSKAFADRVDKLCKIRVCEAKDGQQVVPGHAYVAPGNSHLLVARDGARYVIRLNDGPPVNRHRPSVDVMFRSVAQNVGPNAVGVILTGMGKDGAAGIREMREQGASTIAQDEASSVVWGMPGEAVKLDAIDKVLPLGKIAQAMVDMAVELDHKKVG